MVTITENIARIQQAKSDIKEAIIAKGGTLADDAKLSEFKDAIDGLPSGGEVNTFGEIMVDKTGTGNRGVKNIILAPEVTMLVDRYQYYNTNLEGINTSNIVTLGKQCFFGCSKLTEIDMSSAKTIGYESFQECTSLERVTIGNSLSEIMGYAFKNCKKLGDIVFYSAPRIEPQSFENCTMAHLVFICNSVPTLTNASSFRNTNCQFIVPDALYASWIAATNWSTYADRIVKASEYQPNN